MSPAGFVEDVVCGALVFKRIHCEGEAKNGKDRQRSIMLIMNTVTEFEAARAAGRERRAHAAVAF
ncbi:hypothetical protein RMSM_07802 [Rhodopirellula maiorica SM1]|uniref:Uncharacterized protein n=1 Tax=Rhodopirellula maiorica SM1 TaxID=1265738 RepID=M5RMT3_9BACT|nr:hypothetical protein RMSM_07802 [Rhodopirellula maiorica SM1]